MEVVEYLGCIGAIANLCLIVGIDNAITIHILIFDITRANGREVLLRTGINVCLILEQTKSDKSIGGIQRITCLHQIVECLRLLSLLLDLILVEIKATTQVKGQVTYSLGIVQRYLEAMAVNDTRIGVRRLKTDQGRVGSCTRNPDIRTVLLV